MQLSEHRQVVLTIPDPFHFQRTIAKPGGWYWSIPGEILEDDTFWTGIYLRDTPVGLKMFAEGNTVTVSVFSEHRIGARDFSSIRSIVWSGMGGDEDLAGFYRFARDDPILSVTVNDLYGMRVGSLDDVFGRTILAILLQMAPMKRSDQMMNALLLNFGNRIEFDGRTMILWPRPRDIAPVDPRKLRQKANIGYRAPRLVQAAKFLQETPLSTRALSALSDEEATRRITEIPGIGEYSAGVIYGHTSFPLDVWSVRIMSELVFGRTPEHPRENIKEVNALLTNRWGKWRWFAFVYILNDLDSLAKIHHLSRIV